MQLRHIPLLFLLLSLSAMPPLKADDLPKLGDRLTDAQVSAFAELALEGLDREYPNKPSHVMSGPESVYRTATHGR